MKTKRGKKENRKSLEGMRAYIFNSMNISSTIEEIVGEGVEPPTKFSKREGLR